MDLMNHHQKWPRRFLTAWQEYSALYVEIGTETREWSFELPAWPWRVFCWAQGHRPYDERLPNDNYCIICRKNLN